VPRLPWCRRIFAFSTGRSSRTSDIASGCIRRGGEEGGGGRALRVHRNTPGRVRYDRRRSRIEVVRRPAAAHRACPRISRKTRRFFCSTRRHLARLRGRGIDQRGLGTAHARQDGDRHRASPFDAARLRPNHRSEGRPDHRRRAPGELINAEGRYSEFIRKEINGRRATLPDEVARAHALTHCPGHDGRSARRCRPDVALAREDI